MKRLLLLTVLVFPSCKGIDRLINGSDSGSVTTRYPSPVQAAWTDQQVFDSLTWDQRHYFDKSDQFFDPRYDNIFRPEYQNFLDGKGPNVFQIWFTDEQFRQVLVACVHLGKLDNLTLP